MIEKLLQWHPAFFAGIQIEFGEEAKKMCKALEELMKDELEAKKTEGKEIGKEIGMQQGKERVNELTLKLSTLGRIDDILKAASDEDYQERLFQEFGL
jgi:hypothetical protein